MSGYRILGEAEYRLEEIFDYTERHWDGPQAIRYFDGFLDQFEKIAARRVPWRAIPAEFGIAGYVCRYERHYIYWKLLSDGAVGIAIILHERMQQIELVRKAFED